MIVHPLLVMVVSIATPCYHTPTISISLLGIKTDAMRIFYEPSLTVVVPLLIPVVFVAWPYMKFGTSRGAPRGIQTVSVPGFDQSTRDSFSSSPSPIIDSSSSVGWVDSGFGSSLLHSLQCPFAHGFSNKFGCTWFCFGQLLSSLLKYLFRLDKVLHWCFPCFLSRFFVDALIKPVLRTCLGLSEAFACSSHSTPSILPPC